MSARAGQIARNLDRYEREWAIAHPGERPGPALRRAWDARAWADDRPDKVAPQPGQNLDERWRAELSRLGYRHPYRAVALRPTPVGAVDRDAAAQTVLARLAAARSAWSPADIRGEAEQLIARAGIVTEPAVRRELAEDLTARALARCVPLLDRAGLPEHLRTWTSRPVLDTEAELTTRLAARAASVGRDVADVDPTLSVEAAVRLDAGQAAAVAALSGQRRLVVVEGAAGAGKTTTLAAAGALLEQSDRRLTVVTPTLKAAKVAAGQLRAAAGSAAWLAHQHGWRWDDDGSWTRLAVGQIDPVTGGLYRGPDSAARLRPGDLLVVDEAGMLDQDTARAVLTVADECRAHLALLGDRHQLPAVGRGGVLDLAVDRVDPAGHLTLDAVHRFTRPDPAGQPVPDAAYAELTLAMRTGQDPGAVFDALHARGQIRLHPDQAALQEGAAGLAAAAIADGEQVAVVVDTREQAGELSAVIRQALVAAGRVADDWTLNGRSGQPIGAGDRVVTRRNDRNLDVANRDTWTVLEVGRRGGLLVTPADAGPGQVRGRVTPGDDGRRVLPDDYVTAHVELAYATTAHGVQGETVSAAHLVIGEQTGAAAAYVGMTRGRQANTAHLVAADLAEAREQWIAVFARDRADLGPRAAARRAAADLARYAPGHPVEPVLAELHRAWTAEQRCRDEVAMAQLHVNLQRALAQQRPPEREQPAALQQAERALAASRQQLTDVRARLARLASEPALAVLSADRLDRERSAWRARQTAEHPPARPKAQTDPAVRQPRPEDLRLLFRHRDPDRGIPR
ncbi:MAG: trwC1 [Frankiales bacterium]|nr:trwC1 [Frankiales bacterium]